MKNYIAQKITDLLPRRIVYFTIIRAYAYVTTQIHTDLTPDEIGFSKLVKPFEKFDYLKSKEGENPYPPSEEKKWLDRTFNEGMGTIAETVKVPYDTSLTHKDWEEWKQNFLQHLSKWNYYSADEELEKAKRFLLSSQKESIVRRIVRKVKEWEKNYEENTIVTFDKTEAIENGNIATVLSKLSASLERDNLE